MHWRIIDILYFSNSYHGSQVHRTEKNERKLFFGVKLDNNNFSSLRFFFSSPKCGTLTWWGGLSGLIKY